MSDPSPSDSPSQVVSNNTRRFKSFVSIFEECSPLRELFSIHDNMTY
ncbi:MAG: hypothetical protein QXF49_07295 [Thermosphaera sp.]